jgi:hypothetical protein
MIPVPTIVTTMSRIATHCTPATFILPSLAHSLVSCTVNLYKPRNELQSLETRIEWREEFERKLCSSDDEERRRSNWVVIVEAPEQSSCLGKSGLQLPS